MAGMKVNFDGLRKQIAKDYNMLVAAIHQKDEEEIIEKMRWLRQSIGGLLCCYDDKCPDDINDLSHIADALVRVDE